MASQTVLGIDLAGVTGSTGYAVLEGEGRPHLTSAGLLASDGTPAEGEERLLGLIDGTGPDLLAIDAPLTLPPCLTCPSYCRGPGRDCELQAARQMWKAGSNPVIRRPCELEAKRSIEGLDPNPTMGLGIITTRAVALVRKLEARGKRPCSIPRGEILEVYPTATLLRLGYPGRPPRSAAKDQKSAFYRDMIDKLPIGGVDEHPDCVQSDDVFDALIAAYTGWLHPDGLEPPPEDFNLASGWIWFPRERDDASVGE